MWLFYNAVLVAILSYIAVVDVKCHKISNKSLMILGIIAVAEAVAFNDSIKERVVCFVLTSLVLIPAKMVRFPLFKPMGAGDVKLMCVMMLVFGIPGFTVIVNGIIIAGAACVILLVFRRVKMNDRVAIGQYLSAAAIIEIAKCCLFYLKSL